MEHVAAAIAVLPHVGFALIGHRQCRDGGSLHEARQPVEHALRQFIGVMNEVQRSNDPPRAPARHGMSLGKTRHREHLIGQFCRQTWHAPACGETGIDLV